MTVSAMPYPQLPWRRFPRVSSAARQMAASVGVDRRAFASMPSIPSTSTSMRASASCSRITDAGSTMNSGPR